MRTRSLLITAATVVMGSLALPVAASTAPAFSLFLYPSKVLIPVGRDEVSLGLLNNGTDPAHVIVTPSEPWLVPDALAFDLAPSASRQTMVHITRPDANGDLDATVAFTVAPTGAGQIRVARGLAAVVIVETSGVVHHGLSWSGLRVPSFVDPMSGPVRLSVTAHNAGNVHETLDPVLGSVDGFRPLENITSQRATVLHWTPTILLRGSSRVLQADWSPPALCWCTVAVRGQAATVIVAPVRAIAGLLLVILAALVVVRIRQRRLVQP